MTDSIRPLLLRSVSYLGLALTVVPSLFVFAGQLSLATYKLLMFIGFLCWITTAPWWINEEQG